MAGRITALEPQKHSGDRVNVYLDDEFAFGLAVLVAANLRVGMTLTAEQIAALRLADEVERAHEQALNYLSYRPRSTAELQSHLLKSDFSAVAVAEVLHRLREVGLVDDEAFARYWIDNRARFRPRGKRMLEQELRQKDIASRTIEAALMDYDEVAAARQVAEEQARRLAHLPPEAARRRLWDRMMRRGFSPDIIQEVLATRPFSQLDTEESEAYWT
ncbi:MAG TPA: RecX family transcriptional regulator [Anaerolineae bacterium]|nr:RecX family transcriptional regulator [Anaerolineae bacterium]HQH38801.1 RecX family transcriptional regulator [Anaerolineae bacterium]